MIKVKKYVALTMLAALSVPAVAGNGCSTTNTNAVSVNIPAQDIANQLEITNQLLQRLVGVAERKASAQVAERKASQRSIRSLQSGIQTVTVEHKRGGALQTSTSQIRQQALIRCNSAPHKRQPKESKRSFIHKFKEKNRRNSR